MRILKRLFIIAIAVAYCASCDDKNNDAEKPVENKIEISPETSNIGSSGGSIEVSVTSSGKWTLEGSYDFVHPSVTSGNNGDVVIFTVEPNISREEKVAEFNFIMGDKKAPFRITVNKEDIIYTLEIDGEKNRTFSSAAQIRISVKLNTNIPDKDLSSEITSSEEGWLTQGIVTEGEAENEVIMYFDMTRNDGMEEREASVKIRGKGCEADLKIVQKPTSKITVDEIAYELQTSASTLEIPVTSNVEFDVTLSQTAQSWFTYDSFSDKKLKFSYQALPEDTPSRSCTATLKEKNSLEESPVTVTLTFSQRSDEALITWAVDMHDTRAWPDWKNADVVTNMQSFTLEALVALDGDSNPNELKTIMGIEGKFLIRCKANTMNPGMLEVIWDNNGEKSISNKNMNINYNSEYYQTLPDYKNWAHVAVTFESGKAIKCYINGEEEGSSTANIPASVNFGVEHNNEQGAQITRCFWVGYSYEHKRDFPGLMSELRIWNRALTTEELKQKNHFYRVDPQSEGLVVYWKCNEGNGNTIKDYTSNGNDLSSDGLVWKKVSLPN